MAKYFQNCPKLTGLAKRGGIGLCFTGLLVYRTTTCNARRLEVMITNKNKTTKNAIFTRKHQQRRQNRKRQHIKETKQDLNIDKYNSSIYTRLQKLTLFNNVNISTMRLSLKKLLLISILKKSCYYPTCSLSKWIGVGYGAWAQLWPMTSLPLQGRFNGTHHSNICDKSA